MSAVAGVTNGLVVVMKRDCPTCELVVPVLARLAGGGELTVYTQDDPTFPEGIDGVEDDLSLDVSHKLRIEIVPTLISVRDGVEVARTYGWDQSEWATLTGIADIGADLPALRPGCGALNVDPANLTELKIRHDETGLSARLVPIGDQEDDIEACFERDWSDGLPVVPPTAARVMNMLTGTARKADEVLGDMPPMLAPCTVEKVAINAVMAGCKPEYLPVVIAAVEAALDPLFGLHGVIATTRYVGPIVIVSGPIARRIGMNAKGNALGQGNRANSTIGRALQLTIRNVGGGKPGGVDRAALGNPGKHTYCFAEDEEGSAWTPLTVDQGLEAGASAVTLFAGYGLQGVVDERARSPEELIASFTASLRVSDNVNKFPAPDCLIVVCPEHEITFMKGGWDKERVRRELTERLTLPYDEVKPGAGGVATGAGPEWEGKMVPKFGEGCLLIVRAGGGAGKFSGIIGGFSPRSPVASNPVTKSVLN
ncbi:MAG: hypothetical protein ACI9DC_003195 [Gammaproteobacteria bacterium]|jgi:hypothetical protein